MNDATPKFNGNDATPDYVDKDWPSLSKPIGYTDVFKIKKLSEYQFDDAFLWGKINEIIDYLNEK